MAYKPRHPREPGRPRKLLEPGVQSNLVRTIELGVPLAIACDAASVSKSAFYEWMQRGLDEFTDRNNGLDPNPDEADFHDLYLAVQEAKAKATVRNLGAIQKAAQGGQITEKSVRKYRDPDTGALVEEETEKRSAPDWRAAGWWLERMHRTEFGKNAETVEVTGAGGGPIRVDAEQLSESLAAHIAAGVGASLPELEGTTTDAEMVDE